MRDLLLLLLCFTKYFAWSTIIPFEADAAVERGTLALILIHHFLQMGQLLRKPPLYPRRPTLPPLRLRRPSTSKGLVLVQNPLMNKANPFFSQPVVDLLSLVISKDAKELLRIASGYASKGDSRSLQTCLSYAFEFLHADYPRIIPLLTQWFQHTLTPVRSLRIRREPSPYPLRRLYSRSASTAPSSR